MIDKVVALITRLGPDGPEVCVFETVRGDRQLPAGTVEPDEGAAPAAIREAFEETGLDGLEVRAVLAEQPACPPGMAVTSRPVEVAGRLVPRGNYADVLEAGSARTRIRVRDDGREGLVDNAALSLDSRRHLVHLDMSEPAPDEWWVSTPDGGGQWWRCHWMPLERTGQLGDWHDSWLDAVRPVLARSRHKPARPRTARDEIEAEVAVEIFFAPPWGGRRALFSLVSSSTGFDDAEIGRAEAAPITPEGHLIAVGGGEPVVWGLPGGRREPGESLVDTLRRELAEEACAVLQDQELVGYQRFAYLRGDRISRVQTDAMYWARVTLDPFLPRLETTARRLMTLDDALVEPTWRHPITPHLFARVEQAEAARIAR